MIRLAGVILLLLALLCGCTEQQDATIPSDDESIQSTEATGEADSDADAFESGMVRGFPASNGTYGWITPWDDAIIFVRNVEGVGILELCDEELQTQKTVTLGEGVLPAVENFSASEQGLAYFDGADSAVVFLNRDLLEVGRLQMPEEVLGSAWISADWKSIYYCTADGICALDFQSGISRLLSEYRSENQKLTGAFAGGKILRCTDMAEQGQKTFLVDAATGSMIGMGAHFETLSLWSNRYFFARYDGSLLRLHFGVGTEASEVFWPLEKGDAYPHLSDDALTVVSPGQNAVTLTYYHMNSGTRVACVTIPGVGKVSGVRADGRGGIWFLGEDTAGTTSLYHWDTAKSKVEDAERYKTPYFSPDQPDEPALRRMAAAAKEIGDAYGVDILLWKDAAALTPSDYTFETEYLAEQYEKFLPELEKALEMLPVEFYKKTAWDTTLKIAVVRSITGDTRQGSQEKPAMVQYWHGKEPVIALTIGGDTQRDFCHAMGLLLETEILSKSKAYYEWHKLNPAGFTYDNNYVTNAGRTDTAYVAGGNRYFIDLFSMSYAKEDRASIFEYACMPGNEGVFQSPMIQKKLQRICKGIREVYKPQQTETPFLWEQYLAS